MNRASVGLTICQSLIEEFLNGYRGYPDSDAGVKNFARALQASVVSVGHARATLESFDEFFPTKKQINDTAWNLRPKFENTEENREEWARLYGKPRNHVLPPDAQSLHWQAIRDMLYYTDGPGEDELGELVNGLDRINSKLFWADARVRAFRDHADTIEFVGRQIGAMGWTLIMMLTASPAPFPYTSEKYTRHASLVPVGAPITQADIDRARQPRKSTAQVDLELDG